MSIKTNLVYKHKYKDMYNMHGCVLDEPIYKEIYPYSYGHVNFLSFMVLCFLRVHPMRIVH